MLYTPFMETLLLQYGLWGIFILALLDHSGLPSGLLLGLSLVSTGLYSLYGTLFVVWLAGMVGDGAFYLLALLFGQPARRFLEKHFHAKEALVKTEKAFEKYDYLFLVWGRFIPFAGRYAPFVYASFSPKKWRFLFLIALGNATMLFVLAPPFYS